MKWLTLLAAVPSGLIVWVAVPLVRRVATACGLVDHPGDRKVHREPTALGGGVAIWLGVMATFGFGAVAIEAGFDKAWPNGQSNGAGTEDFLGGGAVGRFVAPHLPGLVAQQPKLWTLLAAASAMMLLGLVDDRRHLDWRTRLALQTLIGCFVVWQGWQMSVFLDAPALTFVLSVIWIVAIVNAFNMLDNMDGLSAGMALIAAVILALVMLSAPDPETREPQLFVAGFLMVLAGSLCGFLVYNSHPASIFMGDAGSYFVGFLLAVSTLMATFAGGDLPRHAIFAPLCVLAVPIYDTLTVLAIRLREGRSPFVGDRSHFSHRLVDLGFDETKAVWTIYLLTGACGLGALLLYQVNALGACVILTMVACVLAVIAVLEKVARKDNNPR